VGGCSDNTKFGEKETRRFIDKLEKGDDARTAFNLHNNAVGRKVTWLICSLFIFAPHLLFHETALISRGAYKTTRKHLVLAVKPTHPGFLTLHV